MKFHSESESIERVKAFYDAADRGDLSAATQVLDPDVEWREPNVPALWFRGIHYGAEAVRREVLEPVVAKLADFSMTMKKYFEVGSHVIVIGRYQGRVKTTGKKLDAPAAHIWTLWNGKVVRFEAYHDGAKWLEAFAETEWLVA
jgi:ketosteroid isomerase-like protein